MPARGEQASLELLSKHRRDGTQPLFNRSLTTIDVPATALPYLRSGLLAEFGSAVDVLQVAIAMDEVDPERWRTGLAQFDTARQLLEMVGVATGSGDFDMSLDDLAPGLARMVLDALRAIYDIEVQCAANAAEERVQPSSRTIPTLRELIIRTERRLGRAAKRHEPLLDLSEKRTPRTVRSTR
jgi:hypothetical protein